MKARRWIRYWAVASLATLAILGFYGAYMFVPPPKGSLARVQWEYQRDADADRETARSRAAKKHISWRSWWDGRSGPIALRWGVSSWPTHYVLDPQGIIRYKNPQGKRFYQAIDRVVAEAEVGTK